MRDPSNGYDALAAEFIARRNRAAIGASVVAAWSRTLVPAGAVLDLGCGHGIPISQTLIGMGFAVHGVDASPAMIEAFRRNCTLAPAECAPVDESGFLARTAAYEGIVAWGLMFLLDDTLQRQVISMMARALKPGGRLLFTAPTQKCTWTDILTGLPSTSLGRDAYETLLDSHGLSLEPSQHDEGGNHYYCAFSPVPGLR